MLEIVKCKDGSIKIFGKDMKNIQDVQGEIDWSREEMVVRLS